MPDKINRHDFIVKLTDAIEKNSNALLNNSSAEYIYDGQNFIAAIERKFFFEILSSCKEETFKKIQTPSEKIAFNNNFHSNILANIYPECSHLFIEKKNIL